MKTLRTSLKMKSMHICLRVRASFRRATGVAVVAALLACPTLGSTHWAIISNLNGAAHPSVWLDVSSDFLGRPVEFTVFPTGGSPSAPFSVFLNENNFASSFSSTFPNLFTLSMGKTAMVRANFIDGFSLAALHEKRGKSEVVIWVPRQEISLGFAFLIPVGDLEKGAFILIGDPPGTDANVSIHYGSTASPTAAELRVPSGDVSIYQVTNNHTNLVLTSDQPVIVQYAVVDNAGTIKETYVIDG